MSDPNIPESSTTTEPNESFGNILSEFERRQAVKRAEGSREGIVVSVSTDSVVLDIGFKTEGILPLSEFQNDREAVKPGDKLQVTIKGRDPEGYYELTRSKAARPKDWAALERAFADKTTIVGTVTAIVKGGLSVDVGVRAFMPASRSGTRDAAAMEKLVEQEIRCRIIKLDATEEDVVVDRRVIAEEEDQRIKDRRYSEVKEGDTVSGTVRRLIDYGAFVDIGGVDALLHVGDISWSRINTPADVLAVEQQIEVKVLTIDPEKRRISVGMKQLQPHPWDFERRMSLGLKQALGDPWADVGRKFPVGSVAEGPVVSIAKFGAFVQVTEGVEGMIHVSDMSAEKRINHPQDVLKVGQVVKAQVLELDPEKRRLKLGIKQLVPTSIDEYVSEHKEGDVVSGRVVEILGGAAQVELGEGIQATCRISAEKAKQEASAANQSDGAKADLASLSSMLQAHWKGSTLAGSPEPQEVLAGQVRSFRITKLDRAAKKIEVELV